MATSVHKVIRFQPPNYSQFGKNIQFMLYTNGQIDPQSQEALEFVLPINPEEFSFEQPERATVVQTLGDPFIDDFGLGLPQINMRGITGWRGRPSLGGLDGHQAMRRFLSEIVNRYSELRDEKIAQGLDPDLIRLVLVNNVDDMAFVVVPNQFRLLRSKSRPLLYQYEWSLFVVENLTRLDANMGVRTEDPLTEQSEWIKLYRQRLSGKIIPATEWVQQDVLAGILDSPFDMAANAGELIRDALQTACGNVIDFLDSGVNVLTGLKNGVGSVANVISGIATVGEGLLGRVLDVQSFIQDLPLQGIVALNHLFSVFSEVRCFLSKGRGADWLPDFSALEGITDCGSTLGVPDGKYAMAARNVMEWASGLSESAKGKTSGLIGYDPEVSASYVSETGVVDNSKAPVDLDMPVLLRSDFSEVVSTMATVAPQTKAEAMDALDSLNQLLATVHFDAEKIQGSDIEVSDHLIQIPQSKTIVVKEGDTLQSIAQHELGDPNRWTEIVAFNDIVVEDPFTALFPRATFTLTTDLAPGTNYFDHEGSATVPKDHAEAGCLLRFTDANGKRQMMKVDRIEGVRIYFNETFSRVMAQPVKVTRFDNRAALGVAAGKTTISGGFPVGSKEMPVASARMIYAGYKLHLNGANGAKLFTVKSVRYLENVVVTEEGSIGFAGGTEIQIFDTESGLVHLEPGSKIKIPSMGQTQANIVQSEAEVFGQDIGLSKAGRLLVVDGDIGIVKGVENLKQAIKLRINCPFNTLPFHPNYGSGVHAIIGRRNSKKTLARAALIESLNREPRLSKVSDAKVTLEGDVVRFSIMAMSTDRNTLTDFNLVLEG